MAAILLGLFGLAVAAFAQASHNGSLGAYVKVRKDACAMARRGKARYEAGDEDGPDDYSGAWQRLAECLKPMRETWRSEGPHAQIEVEDRRQLAVSDAVRQDVLGAMRSALAVGATARDPGRYVAMSSLLAPGPALAEPIVRLVQLNDLHVPYNAMSQSALATALFHLARQAAAGGYPQAQQDARFYHALALASMRTVLTPVEQGGIASVSRCGAGGQLKCAWYNAVTNTYKPTAAGGTLNKSIQAMRDMALLLESGDDLGEQRTEYDPAIAAGLNQLFLSPGHVRSGAAPNLRDFLLTPDAREGSWAYYSVDPLADQPTGHMNHAAGKSCRYHYRDLDELTLILQAAEARRLAPEARARAFACDSPLRKMYLATQLPDDRANMLANAPAGFCEAGIRNSLGGNLTYLRDHFAACPR